jgi:hypothetical protein
MYILSSNIYYVRLLFKLKLEMCTIPQDESMTRQMKERLVDTWVPRILNFSKKLKRPAVIMDDMDEAVTKGDISESGMFLIKE